MKTSGVGGRGDKALMPSEKMRASCSPVAASDVNLERQLQTWRDDPSWTDQPPEIKVLERFYTSIWDGHRLKMNVYVEM